MFCSRHLDILEEVLVAFQRNRCAHGDLASSDCAWVDIRVGRHRCDRHEEGPLALDRIVQESFGFLCNHVRRVLALVADWRIMVSLIGCVDVGVSVGVQKEVGAIEPINMRAVIVLDGVGVEEFPGVVGVITSFLEPDGQEVLVEPAIHEFWISTFWYVSPKLSFSIFTAALTVWRVHVRHICVMCLASGPQADS